VNNAADRTDGRRGCISEGEKEKHARGKDCERRQAVDKSLGPLDRAERE
jgi:hypothetical protein